MKVRLELDSNFLREVIDYDEDTGLFTWKVRVAKCVKIGEVAGTVQASGYVQIFLRNKGYLAHRLAFIHKLGKAPDYIDHINSVRSDNRWCNLREASATENRCHSIMKPSNVLGVKNVTTGHTKNTSFYLVQVMIAGKRTCKRFTFTECNRLEKLKEAEEFAYSLREQLHVDFVHHSIL